MSADDGEIDVQRRRMMKGMWSTTTHKRAWLTVAGLVKTAAAISCKQAQDCSMSALGVNPLATGGMSPSTF